MSVYTEAEARRKICHKTLGATVIAGEANYYPASCIASECMAWVRIETPTFAQRAEAEFRRTGKSLTSDTGRCGLVQP